jgi:hypothetical protein
MPDLACPVEDTRVQVPCTGYANVRLNVTAEWLTPAMVCSRASPWADSCDGVCEWVAVAVLYSLWIFACALCLCIYASLPL